MEINRQASSNGGTVGGPAAHIRSLRVGDVVQGRGEETCPVVADVGG